MSALDALLDRARGHAEARAVQRRRGIAEEASTVPGISAHVEGENVVLEGRRLLDRWIRDASLRNVGRTAL